MLITVSGDAGAACRPGQPVEIDERVWTASLDEAVAQEMDERVGAIAGHVDVSLHVEGGIEQRAGADREQLSSACEGLGRGSPSSALAQARGRRAGRARSPDRTGSSAGCTRPA